MRVVGVDGEWSKAGLSVLGVAWDDGEKATAVNRNDTTMQQWLGVMHKADVVVGQNLISADYRQLEKEGHSVDVLLPKTRDTRLMAHAVAAHLAGTGSLDLRSLALLFGSRQGKRFPLDFKKYESDIIGTCAMDSAAALRVYGTLERLIEHNKLGPTVEISHRCERIFSLMHTQGIRLDTSVLKRIHEAKKRTDADIIERYQLWEDRGKKVIKRVPIWRTDKMLDLCEHKFGVRPKDKKRVTLLKLLADPSLTDEAREFIQAWVDLGRGANTSTFVGKAEADEDGEISFGKVDENGFIHPRYDICGSPDRAIASGPNIAQWPRPSDDPRPVKIREAVIALQDDHVLLGCDYSSLETITNAYEAGDMDCVNAVLSKKRTHEGTADLINKAFGLSLNRTQGKIVSHGIDKGECVAPDTKILLADLTWVDAASLKVGDELIGFDEEFHGKKSCYRRSVVQKVGRIFNPCYLVETDKGSMVASANHAWLVRGFQHTYEWQTTAELKPGKQLKFFGQPWSTDTSHAAGCLKGFFDGEGCVCRNGRLSMSLSMSQNTGATLDYYRNLLIDNGYEIRERQRTHKNSKKLSSAVTLKSRYSCIRFLGSVRPVRLLKEAHRFWENASVTGGRHEQPANILRITYIGNKETVAIQTSTKTLITNGFLTHNSPYNMARSLFKTDRPSRVQVAQVSNIINRVLAEFPKLSKFRDDLWARSIENPLTVTNSFGRRLMCFSRSKYGDANERFAKHDPSKKYWCSCGECAPRRDRFKYATAFLGRSCGFDALLRVMAKVFYEKRLDAYSLPIVECHDELVYSVPKAQVEYYAKILKEAFEEPIPELNGLSLPANVVWGSSWASAH